MADRNLIDRQMHAHLAWIDSALEYIRKSRELIETMHGDTRRDKDLAATLAMTVLQELMAEERKTGARQGKRKSRRAV